MVFSFRGGIRKLSDLNMVIKNNTKVYLTKWHQVARASSIEQGLAPQRIMPTMPQGRPVPTGSVVPESSSGSQEQEAAPQDVTKLMKTEVAMKTRTGRTCEVATCGLLGRHVGGTASGFAKQQLAVFWQARVRKLRNKLLSFGNGTSRSSSQW